MKPAKKLLNGNVPTIAQYTNCSTPVKKVHSMYASMIFSRWGVCLLYSSNARLATRQNSISETKTNLAEQNVSPKEGMNKRYLFLPPFAPTVINPRASSIGMSLSLRCLEEKLKKAVHCYPDFPKRGVLFRDLLPVMQDVHLMEELLDCIVSECRKRCGKLSAVVAMEARGFLFGPLIALKMGLAFVPIRKPGKLPGKVASVSYAKEYGEDTLEVQADAIQKGSFVLLFDDVLATGGTAAAAVQLLNSIGVQVAFAVFLAELLYLKGAPFLKNTPYLSLLQFDS
uniref:Adenine phosphoribosyltransferase n=1 Tax=Trichuris muris TaxID=70415 RepID=A0A5S6QPY6_TRIMR